MRRLLPAALAAALCALLAACGPGDGRGGRPGGGPPGPGGPGGGGYAVPSKLIATDLAFARAAKERGQWTAFVEYAAKEATLFDPQPMPAHPWLKGRTNPASAISWQPYSVWLSCDGSLGISQGAWQQADTHGRYVTVWARQDDGAYRWIITQRGTDMENLVAPEMLDAKVASCKAPSQASHGPDIAEGAERSGASRDRSLDWAVQDDPRCGRLLTATMARGPNEDRQQIVRLRISAPADASNPPGACPG